MFYIKISCQNNENFEIYFKEFLNIFGNKNTKEFPIDSFNPFVKARSDLTLLFAISDQTARNKFYFLQIGFIHFNDI